MPGFSTFLSGYSVFLLDLRNVCCRSYSLSAFCLVYRHLHEYYRFSRTGAYHSGTKYDQTPLGTLAIASAANDDVTAWCCWLLLLLFQRRVALPVLSILWDWLWRILQSCFGCASVSEKVGEVYANKEAINKTFVAFILLILIISSCLTEIIGIHALFGAFMAGVVMPSNLGFRKVMMERWKTFLWFFPAVILCFHRLAYGDRSDQQSGVVDGVFAAGDSGHSR